MNYDKEPRNIELTFTGKKSQIKFFMKQFEEALEKYFEDIDDEETVYLSKKGGKPPSDPPDIDPD